MIAAESAPVPSFPLKPIDSKEIGYAIRGIEGERTILNDAILEVIVIGNFG